MNKKEGTKEIPRVIVPQGAQKRIASHFGVSGETVRKALKYIINTELAVRIREEAIKNYAGAELYLANLHTSFLCNLIYPTFSRILLYSC